jgi:hypothetical protein
MRGEKATECRLDARSRRNRLEAARLKPELVNRCDEQTNRNFGYGCLGNSTTRWIEGLWSPHANKVVKTTNEFCDK